ncbi:DUF6151 family protein [Paraliomyxa miuraensis]|uniref:DUF6151 family protein n=1 Tax=Paraliomyxa miuraensis TaxID=376150 RepID=UPI00224E3B29|nr:DUF6151 family protein [Paraliomyxa miuraensis]MCX4240030.1 DUF6151 family protein [Paraliomyxa miuraensis]
MSTDVELRCACGTVQGVVIESSARTCNRAVCYCDDCQTFAHFLGRDDVMNERGGTDILQVAPSRVRFSAGQQELRCMRLSPKGVLRWYTTCCKTPAGNMLHSPRSPFVGFAMRFVAPQGSALDAAVGTPRGSLHGRYAIGGCPEGVPARVGLGLLVRSVGWVLGNAVAGRHRGSPFWTASGEPISAPEVLTLEQRNELRAAVAGASTSTER